jgi:hypothetical protein
MLPWMTEMLPQLNSDNKVCDKCHKKMSNLKCDSLNNKRDDSDDIEQLAKITAMQSLNESLQSIDE